jgi:hypothetical protein
LAGTLAVSLTGSFMPQEGDVFEIMTASSFGGSAFTSASLPALTGSLVWNISYAANLVALSVSLPGDFDDDGSVDAADYVVWRKGLGSAYTQSDYNIWRTHFGQTAGSASGASANITVPERASPVPLIFAAASWFLWRRRAA